MAAQVVTTVRMDRDQGRLVSLMARADDIPVSEFVRRALDLAIAERRQDEEFMSRLAAVVEEDALILAGLRKYDEGTT